MPVLTDLTTQLASHIDALVDADVAVLSDSESIEALHRQLDRLEAVVSRATARFSADSGHRPDGAYSAATWLATRRHLPMTSARRRVRLGRALRHMGVVEEAWLAGDIGSAQVAAFESVYTPGRGRDLLPRREATGRLRDGPGLPGLHPGPVVLGPAG